MKYIGHPRFDSLLKFNDIKAKDFLSGQEEAKAFENKEYVRLHLSTLRKVDCLANLLNRAIDGTLKVNSKWWDIYGITPQSIFEYLTGRWWFQILWTLLTLILGAWIGRMF